LPQAIGTLADLACDLRWSWSHATDSLWSAIEATIWERTRNPVLVLQNASRGHLERLAAEPAFVDQVLTADAARRQYLTRRSWFEQAHADSPLKRVAYFSMEYGITDALPLYSGGLGALAGDQADAGRRRHAAAGRAASARPQGDAPRMARLHRARVAVPAGQR